MKSCAFIILITISLCTSFIINEQETINLYASLIPDANTTMPVYPKGGHAFIFGQPGWMDPLFLSVKNDKMINN
jgi:hypothetical protein